MKLLCSDPLFSSKSPFIRPALQQESKSLIPSFSHSSFVAKEFDWGTKWLKGDEYYCILKHADEYAEKFQLKKYPPKTHPNSIYLHPESIYKNSYVLSIDGTLYFVEGMSVGSEFGFPRVSIKKNYKWYDHRFLHN